MTTSHAPMALVKTRIDYAYIYCNRMVVLYSQIALETVGSFTVLEHKTKYFLLVKCCTYIFQSSFTIITQVTVHIK